MIAILSPMKTHWTDAQGDEVGPDSKVVDCCRCHTTILAEKAHRIDDRPACSPCYLFMTPIAGRSGQPRPQRGDLSGSDEDIRLLEEAMADLVARRVEDAT